MVRETTRPKKTIPTSGDETNLVQGVSRTEPYRPSPSNGDEQDPSGGGEVRGEASGQEYPTGKDYGLFGHMFTSCPLSPVDASLERKFLREAMTLFEPDRNDREKLQALENASVSAGYTFLGQFIVHDLTFDPTSIEERVRDPKAVTNFRTPALDLDSLYGSGPRAVPWLYDPDHYGSFLLHRDDDPYDVARNPKGVALMADPRNDDNLILAQLHVAFLKLHNLIMERLDEKKYLPPEDRFEEARRLVILLYQHVVWHDYLPKICEKEVLDYFDRNREPLFYDYKSHSKFHEPYLPVEFNTVFRFGHAQLKPRYRLNAGFEAEFGAKETRKNLRGAGRALTANQRIDWSYFFPDERLPQCDHLQLSRRIGPHISSQVADLAREALHPAGQDVTSLPERDLRRAENWRVASGNDVSRAMDSVLKEIKRIRKIQDLVEIETTILPDSEILTPEAAGARAGTKEAPLLYYVLREAEETQKGGERLGIHGSWIMAEVIHGMLTFSKTEENGDTNGSHDVARPKNLFLEGGKTWNPTLEPCLVELLGDTERVTMSVLLRLADTRKPIQLVTYPTTP